MYRLVDKITPEQLETIASYLYIEMLKAGYTSVAEFHYLHHSSSGAPYEERTELALRIASAAKHTGIGLTLLPVLYSYAGFGAQPPSVGQRRFINDSDSYLNMYESLTSRLASEPMQRTGLCFHSLRAVTPEQIGAILACHLASSRFIFILLNSKKRLMTARPGPASARWSGCTTIFPWIRAGA